VGELISCRSAVAKLTCARGQVPSRAPRPPAAFPGTRSLRASPMHAWATRPSHKRLVLVVIYSENEAGSFPPSLGAFIPRRHPTHQSANAPCNTTAGQRPVADSFKPRPAYTNTAAVAAS
jgi:hypothetical protein